MKEVCNALSEGFEVLRHPQVFERLKVFLKTLRDSSTVKVIVDAMDSRICVVRFKYVHWFSVTWTRLEAWGSSCPCHQAEWLAGHSQPCDLRGRLISIAYNFACERMKYILEEAVAWTASDWMGDRDFLIAAVWGCTGNNCQGIY